MLSTIPTSVWHPPLLQHQTDKLGICIIIPTYNNSNTILDTINQTSQYTSNIIVVNDGSTDDTQYILETISGISLVSYLPNRGKGWALRKGFEAAYAQGYSYAITIDSDGQHFPSDIPAFINKLEAEGPCLIIGARNMTQAGVPSKSSFGNKFSNFWFWVETGIHAPDTQSGFRLYPLVAMKDMKLFTVKYEFEIEVIVKAAWRNIKIVFVPISVYYAPGKERISHFRPFADFSRISALNTLLVSAAVLIIKPRDTLRALKKKATYLFILNQIFNANDSIARKSLAIALGVFIGIAPIWGFQIICCLFLSTLFKLNRYLVVLSANISIPPMIPVIIYASYLSGSLFTRNSISIDYNENLSLLSIHKNFIQYFIGSILLATLAAIAAGLLAFLLLQLTRYKSLKSTK